jgi:two-component system, chemotaxis family, CheB/CheR fusion protein
MTEDTTDRSFEALLTFLKTHRGFDFTGYRRNSLKRRTRRRMQIAAVETYDEYRDYLEVHPEEFALLFDTILINVTSFFRDEAAWQFLASDIVPGIVKDRSPADEIRVWSAGCASGEEPYSLAMLLSEALAARAGGGQARPGVKIYATDVDGDALAQARQATYTAEDVAAVPGHLRDKYLEPVGSRYAMCSELRRMVIFGRHDLAHDAPISNLDMLVCRNTLIYFNAEMQRQILGRFHFALKEEGVLFLGQAEMLLTHTHLFRPVEIKHRIFGRVPQGDVRQRTNTIDAGDGGGAEKAGRYALLRTAALDAVPLAQLVIDHERRLVAINARARSEFKLDERDLGRPLQDLEISYRPVELRSLIDRAEGLVREVVVTNATRIRPENETQYLDVRVTPLQDDANCLVGVSVVLEDVTPRHDLEEQAAQARQQLETTYEELQSTNEELETTNEELQSAIEELQTTNEELQSTNEEMETINEELHSSNDELREMNIELRQRTVDAQRANVFLESILSSLDVGVIVLERDLTVMLWNHRAEDLWGLRAEEVRGRSLLELDIGLPVGELRAPLRAFLHEEFAEDEITVEARNRRGQTIECHMQATRRLDPEGEPAGIVLLMEEERI